MATETDVYQIDATQAIDSMRTLLVAQKNVNEETAKSKEKHKSLVDFLNEDLKKSLFESRAQYDLLKEAVKKLGEFLIDSVGDFQREEIAVMRLDKALENAGVRSVFVKQRLSEQAETIERLTGTQSEHTMALQALITTFGVAPKDIERFTRAAENLAVITGQDSVSAAKLLARAHAEGKEDLKRYGIEVDATDYKMKGFAATLEVVEKRFGDISAALPDDVKRLNELKGAWDDFKKAVGESTVALVEFAFKGQDAVGLLDFISETLTGKHKKALEESAKATAELAQKQAELNSINVVQIQQLADAEKARRDANEGVAGARQRYEILQQMINGTRELIAVREKEIAQLQGEGGGIAPAEDPAAKAKHEAAMIAKADRTLEARKAELAKLKKADEDYGVELVKQYAETWHKLGNEDHERENQYDNHLASLEFNTFQTWDSIKADYIANLDAQAQADYEAFKLKLDREQQLADKIKEIRHQLVSDLRGLAQQEAGNAIGALIDMGLQNTKFAAEKRKIELEQRVANEAAKKGGLDRLAVEKQIQDEQGASFAKGTAELLASIGKQAAVKAVFNTAEGIAALTNPLTAAEAPGYFTSAGIFAALAAATGGGAAAISATRGLTSDEQAQLDSASSSVTSSASSSAGSAASSRSAGSSNASVATQVNVYQIGITGQTEAEQGREVERIRRKYDDLKMGG